MTTTIERSDHCGMTCEEAIASFRAQVAAVDEQLYIDLCERLAIRDPPGEWELTYHEQIRLWHKTAGGYRSRYIWALGELDRAVDRLLGES